MATSSFFNSDQFMPHGMCYLWQPNVLWTSVISDVLTALAYYSFTIAFIVFVRKRHDLQYPWFFVLAGSVIFWACGTSHLLAAVVIWEPIYGVLAIVKVLTAASSIVAGVTVWYVLPFFLRIPSPTDLQRAKDKSDKRGRELKWLNENLEYKVDKRTEELTVVNKQLQKLKNYMQNILNSMPSVLIGVDEKLVISQWNNTAEDVVGIKAEDALGENLNIVKPLWDIDQDRVTRAIANHDEYVVTSRKRKREGIDIFEDITIYPLHRNNDKGAVIRIDDVTAQVRLQETMVQSEKMLSVGGLAAGMAHEINNPLAGMVQTASVMKQRLTDKGLAANEKAAEKLGLTMPVIYSYMESRGIIRMLDAINDSGHRIAEIVDNMLSFARKNDEMTSSHNIAKLLDKTLELSATDYDLKKHYDFREIELIREYSDELIDVPCEASKIRQVLLNIFRNGAQAMTEAGIENPQFIIRAFPDKYQKLVTIEIEDNGPGMDEETRKRVFEPFFTTKAVGIGTGLGLSVSYFIITENHGGKLSVESELGKGTKFVIQLPV